jgi:cation diffusion facilitator CzcD-associated flavoprotein CzcO
MSMSSGGGSPRVVIIGSGFGGLCMGIQLKLAGIESFTILEKAGSVGGTWRDNTYPGAACDSPSFVYQFSFELKTDWSRKWAEQPEILAYIRHCARKYDIERHIRFNAEVASATFDEHAGMWRIRTATGETIEAEVLVTSVGQLNRPSTPHVPGLERFKGIRFHSARWEHRHDLRGKRVAVIGNAASAVQFVPPVAKEVARLHVFQRTANWIIAKNDRFYSEREKRMFARFPFLARLYRWWIWLTFEVRFPVFRNNELLGRASTKLAEQNISDQVRDPALQRTLRPDYPIGGKRILISDDYYAALQRENVELVTSPIASVTDDAFVTADGRTRPVDAVILATGFETTGFLVPMRIEGRDGRVLEDVWKNGAEAYLGLTVAGFPNFFMLYGPNTNLGHNSIIFMLECQVGYIMACIEALRSRDLAWIDVRPEVMQRFNAALQSILERSVWARTDHSWYKRADGRITNNWSSSCVSYWWQTRRPDLRHYHLEARAAHAAADPVELRRAARSDSRP